MSKLVLASNSPRRRSLLQHLGLDFLVAAPDLIETISPDDKTPVDTAERLALEKATRVSRTYPGQLVLGADTIVVLDGDMLGKPATEAEAVSMLTRLSGRDHVVVTGLALVHASTSRSVTVYEQTEVEIMPLSAPEIASYVSTGSPMDKAGAYGIQDDRGALFVSRIQGDFYNVMGLPLHRLYVSVRTHFPDLCIF